MFHEIKIGSKGGFVKHINDPETKEGTQTYSLLHYLGAEVELDEDCTFGNVWAFIEKDYAIYNIIFKESMGSHDINDWIEELKNNPDTTSKNYYDYLYVSRTVEISNWNENDVPDIYIGNNFGGYGNWDNPDNYPDMPEKGGLSISDTPINELMNVPLRIDHNTHIETYVKDYVDFKDSFKQVGPYKNTFTVYELLEAILYEITWHGSPKNRDDFFCKLKTDIAEIKQKINDANGDLEKAGLVIIEDIITEMKDKNLP